MPARYEITPDAKRDIRSIWLYTEEHWGERQADRYTGLLDRCMDRIARRRALSRRFSMQYPEVLVRPAGANVPKPTVLPNKKTAECGRLVLSLLCHQISICNIKGYSEP